MKARGTQQKTVDRQQHLELLEMTECEENIHKDCKDIVTSGG